MRSKLLILLVLLLLLGGGGAAAYFMLGHKDAEAAVATKTEPDEPGQYVTMPPINVSKLRPDGSHTMVTFHIVLELAPSRSLDELGSWMPRLEDAFIIELAGLLGYNWPNDAPIDVEFARRRLLARSERVLGAPIVGKVLIPTLQRWG
jgi:hypothetical protein